MSLTETGLQIRRFPEVNAAIQAAILQNVSTDIIFDEDLLITQLVNIIAAEIASLEEVMQSVYDSLDRDKAEGASLDSLLNLIGLQRNSAANTNGLEQFTGNDGTTIPQGTILENPSTKDRFQTTQIGLLQQAACLACDYQVGVVADSTVYTVNINGGDYSYTSGIGATATSIVNGLVNSLNTPTTRVWQASSLITPDRLRIVSNNGSRLALVVQNNLLPERVVDTVQIEALVSGEIRAPSNSVTSVITAVGGITFVTNTEALGTGRERETDEEFRLRASQSLSLSGSATIPALTAALLNIAEVSSAVVVENVTAVTDAGGRPSKSFEAIVTAPDTTDNNLSIGQVIWNDKPAGIETFGNSSVTITDSLGIERTINYSRPAGQFIATRVTYTLYNEELFPAGGNALIQNAVVEYGNSLSVGEDVIPKRFYGAIYSAVSGIDDLTVECQTLTSQGDTPDGGLWSEALIPISDSSVASFSSTDVYPIAL